MSTQITSQTIWNSVKELLYKHDCVIMPNFGGFVCNPETARIDQVSHIITPPARRVVFNQNLKTNDGLLVQTVAVNNNLSYANALIAIDEVVNEFKLKLENIKQIEIDSFGTFRLNAEANYVFLPNKNHTYQYTSFGLLPLQAKPVTDMVIGAKRTRIFKDRKDIKPVGRKQRAKNFALKAVAVALFIMLGINGYIFLTDANLIGGAKISTTGINSWFDSLIATDHKQVEVTPNEVITNVLVPETSIDSVTPIEDNSNIAPEENTSTQEVTEETNNANLNIAQVFAHTNKEAPTVGNNKFNDNGELIVAEILQPTQPEEIKTTTTNTKAEVNITSTTQVSFHVIGGVFCNEKNARKFYKLLKSKGFDAELLLNKKINCNRVSYRKVSTREEAYQLMDSIKTTENPEAWVLAVKE